MYSEKLALDDIAEEFTFYRLKPEIFPPLKVRYPLNFINLLVVCCIVLYIDNPF